MKIFISTILVVCCLSVSCFASGGNVTVRDNGTYTVGASRIGPTAPSVPTTPQGPNGPQQPKTFFKSLVSW